jgi:hypothetical protein
MQWRFDSTAGRVGSLARARFPSRSLVRRGGGAILAAGILVAGGQGGAGHSVGHFPSFYPDEIRIEALDPAAAGRDLVEDRLHAYVGAAPNFAGTPPEHVRPVRSLGSFLVLSFKTGSGSFAATEARCVAARSILSALRNETAAGFIFHPYPVTPFHADYLHHADRVDAAKAAVERAPPPGAALKIGARGETAAALVRTRFGTIADAADVTLDEIRTDDLLAAAGVQFSGWSGPPWIKEGWFQAYVLLGPVPTAAGRAAEEDYERLIRGETLSLIEHAEAERRLVAALASTCERVAVGYTLREEYINEAYPPGMENVAYDAQRGLNSPIFVRTAKLKEYPWNGKLHLAVRERPQAAWNPVAGFSDEMGRLIWGAVGDPAMIQFPFSASWMPNRVQAEVTKPAGVSGGLRLPADAVLPEPGSGALRQVGARAFASAKVVYEVIASPFEDGSDVELADLLYPFAFAYRWGAASRVGGNPREPQLAAVLAPLQERLAGIKFVRVERTVHDIAEGMKVTQKTPVLEVYLKNAPGDERQMTDLAPPWSPVPWHVLVLMEEAVTRGLAAFSEEEAARRKVPWLDLVRDPALLAKLRKLIAEFEAQRYRPPALADFVTPEQAQARWRALRSFAEKRGHLLVTNGPYRLKEWSRDTVVLEAVREITYPLGFGTFDRFVNPPRALIESVTREGNTIAVRASAEMLMKAGRQYKLMKEPLLRTTMRGTFGLLVVSRYLLIGPDGAVLKLDKMQWAEDGRFIVPLPEGLPAGQYTVLLTVFLDGNTVEPSVARVDFRSR